MTLDRRRLPGDRAFHAPVGRLLPAALQPADRVVSDHLQRLRARDHRLHDRHPDPAGAPLRAADPVAEGDAADGAAHPRGEPQAQGQPDQDRRGDAGPLPRARGQPGRGLPAGRAPAAAPLRPLPGAHPSLERGDPVGQGRRLRHLHAAAGGAPGDRQAPRRQGRGGPYHPGPVRGPSGRQPATCPSSRSPISPTSCPSTAS